jgi:hypothetical protein
VPHREAPERLFVLAPLADLAPRLVPPGWRETVETARRRRTQVEGEAAVRAIARWRDGSWAPLDDPGQAESRNRVGSARSTTVPSSGSTR